MTVTRFFIFLLILISGAACTKAALTSSAEDENSQTEKVFTNLDSADARAKIRQKRFMIESLYREEKSAYPGMTSNIVRCPEDLRPIIQEEIGESQMRLRVQFFANSRKVAGVCIADEVRYRAIYVFNYCVRDRRATETEGFTLKKLTAAEWKSWLSSAKCP